MNKIIYKQYRRLHEGHITEYKFFNFDKEKLKLQLAALGKWELVRRMRGKQGQ